MILCLLAFSSSTLTHVHPFKNVLPFFHAPFLHFFFVRNKKRWSWMANSAQSTYYLVKMHNTLSLSLSLSLPFMFMLLSPKPSKLHNLFKSEHSKYIHCWSIKETEKIKKGYRLGGREGEEERDRESSLLLAVHNIWNKNKSTLLSSPIKIQSLLNAANFFV